MAKPNEMQKRVNHLMAKLADRDTESLAYAELQSICRNLAPESLPAFIAVVGDTRTSDKPPLRRHSLRLIALLARSLPPETLLPHVPRIVSAALRRIRDIESVVRSAFIDAIRSLAGAASARSLVSSIARPLVDALFHEQELHPQSASAFALSAVLDEPNAKAAADLPDYLQCLVPRLMKLVRNPAFKAKPALLVLLGSAAGAGGARDGATLRGLVPCLVEFLGSEDWSARKSAAEALVRLAAAERDCLGEFKLSCVAFFEARRYDKVKIVRDSINGVLEAWRKIPDRDLGVSKSQSCSQLSSSQEDTAKCQATVNSSSSVQPPSSFIVKKTRLSTNRSPPSTSSSINSAKKIVVRSRDLKHKTGQRKNAVCRVENGVPDATSYEVVCEDKLAVGKGMDEKNGEQGEVEDNDRCMSEAKRAVFEQNCKEKKMDEVKSRSLIGPFYENMSSELIGEALDAGDELFGVQKDCDLTLIQNHLVQIENHQFSLLDLLQKFIDSSQNGINSLEMRVQNLEMTLEGISRDLNVSSGRLSKNNRSTKTCCGFPVTEFLSSKLWRRMEGRYADIHDFGNMSGHEDMKSSLSFSTLWNKQKHRPSGRFENSFVEFNSCSRGSVQHTTTKMQGSAAFDNRINYLQGGFI